MLADIQFPSFDSGNRDVRAMAEEPPSEKGPPIFDWDSDLSDLPEDEDAAGPRVGQGVEGERPCSCPNLYYLSQKSKLTPC